MTEKELPTSLESKTIGGSKSRHPSLTHGIVRQDAASPESLASLEDSEAVSNVIPFPTKLPPPGNFDPDPPSIA